MIREHRALLQFLQERRTTVKSVVDGFLPETKSHLTFKLTPKEIKEGKLFELMGVQHNG